MRLSLKLETRPPGPDGRADRILRAGRLNNQKPKARAGWLLTIR
jgi:hypothetical protein